MDLKEIKQSVDLMEYGRRKYGLDCSDKGRGRCPFHPPDDTPSFSIWKDPEGVWRYKCFHDGSSGTIIDLKARLESVDTNEAIRRLREEFNGGESVPAACPLSREHIYLDASSSPVFKKVKRGSSWATYHFENDGCWIPGKGGLAWIPYRLNEFEGNESVIICEGEKDADTVAALNTGYTATSAPTGMSNWPDEISRYFACFVRAYIIYDVGNEEYARKWATKLRKAHPDLQVFVGRVPLKEREADITDYLGQTDDSDLKRRWLAELIERAECHSAGKVDELEAAEAIERIREIKSGKATAEERLRQVSQFVADDLLSNLGRGYRNSSRQAYYFFDQKRRTLLNIESVEFGCFMKVRYGLPEKDMVEVLSWIRSSIWNKCPEVEPRLFSFYDAGSGVLFISSHEGRMFRLDGKGIRVVDNGTAGVIFENRAEYASIPPELALKAGVDYFGAGFDWEKCKSEGLLYRHVIHRNAFAREERHNLSAEDQAYLLSLYTFSLFFESIQEEKPILCFTGVKSSGKSFLSTALGKVLFGQAFLPSHLSDTARDFKASLADNYFVVFDNLDTSLPPGFIDAFCVAATGGKITSRKLYTDNDEIQIRPRVFLAITSRDPHFKRDDFVDRLMIFNTERIEKPISKSALFTEILRAREAIWGELLVNLNAIVRLLWERKDWQPRGVFRIADWEAFGRKIQPEGGDGYFMDLLERMNKEKSQFGIEDDDAYIALRSLVYDQGEQLNAVTGADLYQRLRDVAEGLKLRSFERRYKNPRSLCRRLANIKSELSGEFDISLSKGHANLTYYTIGKKPVPEEAG